MKLTPADREALVDKLEPRAAAVYKRLTVEPLKSVEQIAERLNANARDIEPILLALQGQGLVEKHEPTKRRPFGPLWRPSADRIVSVGDWLKGGSADRGYDSLADIRRDYPSVKTLSDPADGAEAAKEESERLARAQEASQRQQQELAAAAEEKAARLAAQEQDRILVENIKAMMATTDAGLDDLRALAAQAADRRIGELADELAEHIRAVEQERAANG